MSISARHDYVSNAKLRRAYLRRVEEQGLTPSEVAKGLGWWYKDHPDTTRVLRTLGLKVSYNTRTKKGALQRTIHRDNVSAMCEAIGVLPTEIGY